MDFSIEIAIAHRERVYNQMLATEQGKMKYGGMIRFLRAAPFILGPVRGAFFTSYYAAKREMDNVVDRDFSLPAGYSSVEDFIQARREFACGRTRAQEPADHLLAHCFHLTRRMKEDIAQPNYDIDHSLLFDAQRFGSRTRFPLAVLDKHYYALDISGTISLSLIAFGEDRRKYLLLQSLGTATRFHYDIRDYDKDIRDGYVNIPFEDCARLGITDSALNNQASPGVQRWFRERAERGLQLLDEHQRALHEGRFRTLTRLVLERNYECPARKQFERVLKVQ